MHPHEMPQTHVDAIIHRGQCIKTRSSPSVSSQKFFIVLSLIFCFLELQMHTTVGFGHYTSAALKLVILMFWLFGESVHEFHSLQQRNSIPWQMTRN